MPSLELVGKLFSPDLMLLQTKFVWQSQKKSKLAKSSLKEIFSKCYQSFNVYQSLNSLVESHAMTESAHGVHVCFSNSVADSAGQQNSNTHHFSSSV